MSFEKERGYVGPGWQPIVEALHSSLQRIEPDYEVAQIKEKFGGLRYYIHESDDFSPGGKRDQQTALINFAEALSYRICEECGRPGGSGNVGTWIRTLCPECREKAVEARRNRFKGEELQ